MKKESVEKLLALVKNSYQEIAASFDVSRRKELWPEAKRLAEEVRDGQSVLDAGCGNGRLLEGLSGREINYVGFDNSSALIEKARENYPGRHFKVVDILEEDVSDKLPIKKFDHIFCLAVLSHVPSQELRQTALQNLVFCLAPGGRLVLSVWNLGAKNKYQRLLFCQRWRRILGRTEMGSRDLVFPWKDSRGREIGQRYYHVFNRQELKRLARHSGLKLLVLKKDKYNYWLILNNK